MSIFFPLDGDGLGKHIGFREDLDAETIRNWHEDLDGRYCGHLDLGLDGSNIVQEDSRGWRVTTAEELQLYESAVDEVGLGKLVEYLRRTKMS